MCHSCLGASVRKLCDALVCVQMLQCMDILCHHRNLKLFLSLDFQNKLDTFLFQDIFIIVGMKMCVCFHSSKNIHNPTRVIIVMCRKCFYLLDFQNKIHFRKIWFIDCSCTFLKSLLTSDPVHVSVSFDNKQSIATLSHIYCKFFYTKGKCLVFQYVSSYVCIMTSCSYYTSCRDSIIELGMELAMRLGPLTCDRAQALNWAHTIIYGRHHT